MAQNGIDFSQLTASSSATVGTTAAEKAAIAAMERSRKLRKMAVPADDGEVRALLRKLGEPITLFGEAKFDRRERLKVLVLDARKGKSNNLSHYNVADEMDEDSSENSDSDEDMDDDEDASEFYTVGSEALLSARRYILDYSVSRGKDRIKAQKMHSELPLSAILNVRKSVFDHLRTFTIYGSQIGDERPVAQVRFSPNGQKIATGGWSGAVKVWTVPSLELSHQCRSHTEQVGGVSWHPRATLSQSESALNLASGAADTDICLWSLSSQTPLAVMKGHMGRIGKIAFHPSGRFLGSASHEHMFRLWDVETQNCLLQQEGHSKEVHAFGFQDDGALCASGGLDCIGRVWDLRTGKLAHTLDGHAAPVLSVDWSTNGYQLATGSSDDTIKIWDMRSLKSSSHTIPAHKNNVSEVKFFRSDIDASAVPEQTNTCEESNVDMETASEDNLQAEEERRRLEQEVKDQKRVPRSGMYLASSGYDGIVNIWSAGDWQLIRSLAAGSGKLMTVDVSGDGNKIATGSFTRSFTLFTAT